MPDKKGRTVHVEGLFAQYQPRYAEHGVAYAVTELLQGETLRDRIASGALPLRHAVEAAIQIARGLSAAHDALPVSRVCV